MDSLLQLNKILGLKFDRVLFDNMNLKNLKTGVKLAKKYYETEASGNINLKNVTLDQAMNSKVWNGIKDSWTDDVRIPKCESTCAEKIRDKFVKEKL